MRALACLLAVLLVGCMSHSERLAEAKAKLVGLKARELRACLPVPSNAERYADTEHVTYEWTTTFPTFEKGPTSREILEGRRRDADPTEPEVVIHDPILRRELDPDTNPEIPGTCELVFALRKGRITDLAVRGRGDNGMNYDDRCLRPVERCIQHRDRVAGE